MATMRMTLAVHTFFGYLSSYCYTRILIIYCIALFYLLNCLTFFWLIYPRSELGLCCYLCHEKNLDQFDRKKCNEFTQKHIEFPSSI